MKVDGARGMAATSSSMATAHVRRGQSGKSIPVTWARAMTKIRNATTVKAMVTVDNGRC